MRDDLVEPKPLPRRRPPVTQNPGERARYGGLWVAMPLSGVTRKIEKDRKLPPTPFPGESWMFRFDSSGDSRFTTA